MRSEKGGTRSAARKSRRRRAAKKRQRTGKGHIEVGQKRRDRPLIIQRARPSLNQRVTGSSPVAPTNPIKHLGVRAVENAAGTKLDNESDCPTFYAVLFAGARATISSSRIPSPLSKPAHSAVTAPGGVTSTKGGDV